MAFFRETLVAILAAIGMGTVLWAVLRLLLLPHRRLYSPVYLLLPVSDSTPAVEETLSELQEIRERFGGTARILLVDCGMGEEQRHMAQLIRRSDPLIGLCGHDELEKVIKD